MRLDRFAQSHFVGDQKSRRPAAVKLLESANLVRPRLYIGCGLADSLAAIRHFGSFLDEGPNKPP